MECSEFTLAPDAVATRRWQLTCSPPASPCGYNYKDTTRASRYVKGHLSPGLSVRRTTWRASPSWRGCTRQPGDRSPPQGRSVVPHTRRVVVHLDRVRVTIRAVSRHPSDSAHLSAGEVRYCERPPSAPSVMSRVRPSRQQHRLDAVSSFVQSDLWRALAAPDVHLARGVT